MTVAADVCAELSNAFKEGEVAEIGYAARVVALGGGTWWWEPLGGQHLEAPYAR